MSIDYGTARGLVRLLTADVDETNLTLTDAMVDGFLALNSVTDPTATDAPRGAVKRAAADALQAVATSEVLLSKVIRTGDGLATDGAKVAAELRAQAQALRVQAAADDDEDAMTAALDGDGFGVLDFTPWPSTS